MRKRLSRTNGLRPFAAAVALLSCALLLVPCAVTAQPSGDLASKSQQAAQLAKDIESLDNQLSVATEAYNSVKSNLDAVTTRVEETRRRLLEIKENLKERREILNNRAATMYKNGRTSMIEVLLETKDFADFLERADYVARVTESDSELIRRIRSSRDSVAQLERQFAEQQRQQEALVAQAATKKNEIEITLRSRQNLLASVNRDIQKLLEEETRKRAQEAAALEAQAQQVLTQAPSSGLARTAMRYLGVPYHWAGEGPGKCPSGEHRICFDCSGLTQYVYKLYGISLPHNAAAQFNRGIKIPLSQARAGDLVFFGMPPHHVGMYLGNDMFIHAPRTGDVVKVTKLSSRSDTSGICRFTKAQSD